MDVRDKAILAGQDANSMLWDRNRPKAATIQLAFVYDLALQARDGPAVECGVYEGGSVVCWAQARRHRGRIIAVDNWSRRRKKESQANFARFDVAAEFMDANSWDAPALIADPVAFCFIDADHTLQGFPRDIWVWPDAMMPGGVLAFHDYDVWKPKVIVKCIVDAWQCEAKWYELGQVGSVIAYRKPG